MKKPALKFIPFFWYTDNNNNFLPPVNLSTWLKSDIDDISLGVERNSSATVGDKYGAVKRLAFSNTVPLPRIDYFLQNGTIPKTPDYLFEADSTNYINDIQGASAGVGQYTRQQNPVNSSSILFEGLTDPMNRQFANNWYYSAGVQQGALTDIPIAITNLGNFKPDVGWSLSAYIKQNESSRFATGSSHDNTRMINARYFAMRLKSSTGSIMGWVWDWQTKTATKFTDGEYKLTLWVEKKLNGWFRVGVSGLTTTDVGESYQVDFGYVEPDTNFTGNWRFGPDTQYGLNGLWWGMQCECGNANGGMTSVMYNYNQASVTRADEIVNARGTSGVEQIFEELPNGCIMFFRFKYPFDADLNKTSGNAKVGVSWYNAAAGSDANFMGFSIGNDKQLRALVRRNNSNTAFFSKAYADGDYLANTDYGVDVKQFKYISVALVYNKEYTQFWVNGVQVGNTDTSSLPPDWQTNNVSLGVTFRNEFPGGRFYGRVNEFSIYHTSQMAFTEQSELAKKLTKNDNPLKP